MSYLGMIVPGIPHFTVTDKVNIQSSCFPINRNPSVYGVWQSQVKTLYFHPFLLVVCSHYGAVHPTKVNWWSLSPFFLKAHFKITILWQVQTHTRILIIFNLTSHFPWYHTRCAPPALMSFFLKNHIMDVLSACIHVHHMHVVHLEDKKETLGSPELEVEKVISLSWRCWKLNPSPLKQRPVLLTENHLSTHLLPCFSPQKPTEVVHLVLPLLTWKT